MILPKREFSCASAICYNNILHLVTIIKYGGICSLLTWTVILWDGSWSYSLWGIVPCCVGRIILCKFDCKVLLDLLILVASSLTFIGIIWIWDCSLEWRVHTGFRSAGTFDRIQVHESHTVCYARGSAAIFMEGILGHTSNAFDLNQISLAVCRQDLACWLWPVQVFSLISDNSHVLHTHTLSFALVRTNMFANCNSALVYLLMSHASWIWTKCHPLFV